MPTWVCETVLQNFQALVLDVILQVDHCVEGMRKRDVEMEARPDFLAQKYKEEFLKPEWMLNSSLIQGEASGGQCLGNVMQNCIEL